MVRLVTYSISVSTILVNLPVITKRSYVWLGWPNFAFFWNFILPISKSKLLVPNITKTWFRVVPVPFKRDRKANFYKNQYFSEIIEFDFVVPLKWNWDHFIPCFCNVRNLKLWFWDGPDTVQKDQNFVTLPTTNFNKT